MRMELLHYKACSHTYFDSVLVNDLSICIDVIDFLVPELNSIAPVERPYVILKLCKNPNVNML